MNTRRVTDMYRKILLLAIVCLSLAACGDDTASNDVSENNLNNVNNSNNANNLNNSNNVNNGGDMAVSDVGDRDQGVADMGDSDMESDMHQVDSGNDDAGIDMARTDMNSTDMGQTDMQADADPMAICGNGILEDTEICDANDLAGETCVTRGFDGGTLACASNCLALDTTACTSPPTCGDDAIDQGETCDGTDLGGQTCELQGRGPGTLACASNCGSFDPSGCGPADTCGDGTIDTDEVCDDTNLGSATCETLGFGPGALGCAADCQGYDTSGCSPAPACGDSAINGNEVCDGALLDGETCQSQGFGPGTLACAGDCLSFDTSSCPPPATCGDGTINGNETCDGALLDGETCESQGFGPGTLACRQDCAGFDTSQCAPAPGCGDGIINGNEVCDGAELDGQTCSSQGAGIGQLACASDCLSFNTSSCCQPDCSGLTCGPDPNCGTSCGTCGQGEACTGGQCVCQPITCASIGATCGALPDGCGGSLNCGTCTNGEPCINNGCGCGTVSDGGTYTVNVPAVDITFDVTLNGQPLSTANTNDSDEGEFILEDPDTGERFYLPETINGSTIQYPTTRRIIPGFYDIYYSHGGAQALWPINNNSVLIEGADLTSPQTIVIDVQTVDITFDVTLNGQPVTTANTNDSDEGEFTLVDPSTGERIYLPETINGSTLSYPTTRRLLAGTYDVHYSHGGTQTHWPINTDRRLLQGVVLDSTQTLVIDVPTVDIQFDVTLNGQPVTTANTNDSDEGEFTLEDPVTADRFYLPETINGSTLSYPTTRRLIPGEYSIFYSHGGTQTFWPINNDHLLVQAAPLTTSQTYVIDTPTVDITFDATLNGQPVTTANTNDSDEGEFTLEDVTTGERIYLPETINGSTLSYPTTRRLIPANYDIYYSNGGTQTFWPINNNHVLYDDVALDTTQTFTIDTPTIDATFDVTLDGQPVTTANTNDSDEGEFTLEDPSTGERILLPETINGSTLSYPTTRRLIPAAYDVYYSNGGTQTFWPINSNHLLESQRQFLTSQTYVFDVPVADITFDITLNGQPVTLSNTNDSDEGELILEDPSTGERFYLPETINGSTLQYPTMRRLIPARYDIYYTNGGTQTYWPINNDNKLACFVAQ